MGPSLLSQITTMLVGALRTRGAGELVSVTSLPFAVGEGRARLEVEVRGFGLLRVGNFRRWVDGYFRETLLVPAGAVEIPIRYRTFRTRIATNVTVPFRARVAPPRLPASAAVVLGLQPDARWTSSVVGGLSVQATADLMLPANAAPAALARHDLAASVNRLPAIRVAQGTFMMPRR